jgi:hypothetical protein
MEAVKISDSEFEITKKVEVVEPTRVKYNINFLKEQEVNILKDMNSYIEKRQIELEEVRGLISKAESIGLKTKEVLQEESILIEETKLEEITK